MIQQTAILDTSHTNEAIAKMGGTITATAFANIRKGLHLGGLPFFLINTTRFFRRINH